MQSIKFRSHVGSDGSLHLKLPEHLADQDLEVIVIYQPVESVVQSNKVEEVERLEESQSDPLVGLFAGSPELAIRSEDILQQEIDQKSGWTWKAS